MGMVRWAGAWVATMMRLWRRLLALLLFIADAASFGLHLAYLAEVETDSSGAKGVGFWLAAVLLVGSAETADEGVEGSPGLAERARAGRRRVGMAEEGAHLSVDLGLAELVQIAEELEHVGPAASREAERRPVVLEVLAEGVPVAAFLGLVAARRGTRGGGGGIGSGGGGGGVGAGGEAF